MPGAGVDRLRVLGIDGDGLHLVELRAVGRADLVPVQTAVFAAEDALQGAHHQHFRIRGRLRQCANGLSIHRRALDPGLSGIVADEKSAVGMVHHPGSDIDGLGICLIHHDVVDHEVVFG